MEQFAYRNLIAYQKGKEVVMQTLYLQTKAFYKIARIAKILNESGGL